MRLSGLCFRHHRCSSGLVGAGAKAKPRSGSSQSIRLSDDGGRAERCPFSAQPDPLAEVESLAPRPEFGASSAPQRLQWITSVSYSESPQESHLGPASLAGTALSPSARTS